jgi:ice-binding like protein/Big-like domain-containing protein
MWLPERSMSTQQFARLFTLSLLFAAMVGCGTQQTATVITPPPVTDTAPKVLMVVPQTNGVATNREVAVVFSKAMDPSTINPDCFKVAGVTGTVTYDAVNKIGAFKAASDYAPNTTYNATVTPPATDLAGTALAPPFSFSFITRATADSSAPNIVAINVAAGATCVPQNQNIKVTFDEQMDSLTINPTTVFIEGVASAVTYNVLTQSATITPSATLTANTTYTIHVTTGVEDMGFQHLGAPFSETFTTGPCTGGGVPPVALCPFIGSFAVLAGSTVTNTGPTAISTDVGVSPGTAVTGFPPGTVVGVIQKGSELAAQGQSALAAGYDDAESRAVSTAVSGDLAGLTFTTGVYKSTSSLALSGDVTLDAQGNADAVFIFQIASTLTTGSGSHVILANGATACNVFWQVGSSATLGTSSVFKGNILALTSITLTTGVNLEGRALARKGAVTLDSDTITGCTCP